MKKVLLSILVLSIVALPSLASTKRYIKNDKGQTTGYTRTYSNGTTKQYDKKGNLEYTYKKSPNGKVTKYSKNGRKLESW